MNQTILSNEELLQILKISKAYVRSKIKPLLTKVELTELSNQIIKTFYSLDETVDVDGNLAKALLVSLGYNIAQIDYIAELIDDYLKTDEKILYESLNNYLKNKYINEVIYEFANNKDSKKLLSKLELVYETSYDTEPVNLGTTSPLDLLKSEDLDRVLESSFGFINNAIPFKGFIPGQVIGVAGPPGGGKTTFMLNEAVHYASNGLRVIWFGLGDMMELDIQLRLLTILSGESMQNIIFDPNKYWNKYKEILKRIDTVIEASEIVSINDIATFIKHNNEKYDVVIIDYDDNLKKEDFGEVNSFLVFKKIYKVTNFIARYGKKRLVYIGSQIKQNYWLKELIPLDALAESSAKQANLDYLITIGKKDKSPIDAGILHLAKARRGGKSAIAYYILNSNGRFDIVDKTQYLTHTGVSA